MRTAVAVVRGALHDLLLNEGLKYIPTGESWEVDLLFTESKELARKSIKGGDNSLYTAVVCDGEGEKTFARNLVDSPNVKLFTKLPRDFSVDTPLGEYHPDWAIVWSRTPNRQGGEKLYLLRETKFGYRNLEKELSPPEWQKVLCGRKHFAVIGADFDVAERPDLKDLDEGGYFKRHI